MKKHIPNMLTVIRIILIPFFMYFYIFTENKGLYISMLLLAGITDVLDGFIARKFNLITDLGRVLDPIADKLTLLSVTFSIAYKGFDIMWYVFYALLIKEICLIAGGIFIYKKADIVSSASWYGKVATVFFYFAIFMLIFAGVNGVTKALTVCAVLISVISGIAYIVKYLKIIKADDQKDIS